MNARVRIPQLAGLVEAIAVFLFFYQALRVLFSVLFGLIYDALFAGTAGMTGVGLALGAVVLALLAPLAAPRRPKRRRAALLASAVLVFLARILLTLNDPQSRLVAAILIVAGTGVYLACRLVVSEVEPRAVVRALILALVVDQLLRAAGHTWDVTLREGWVGGQVVVSLGLCLLAGWLFQRRQAEEKSTGVRLGLLGGLAWGGWLFLQMSLYAFPNAIARWSTTPYLNIAGDTLYGSPGPTDGRQYALIAALLPAVTLLALVRETNWIPRADATGLAAVLISGLAFFVLGFGLAVGYLATGIPSVVGLLLSQFFALILLSAGFSQDSEKRETRTGLWLTLGGVSFLVLSFAYAFTFTYPYTLELFQGMGLPVFLLAALLVGLPAFRSPVPLEREGRPAYVRTILILITGAFLVVMFWLLVGPVWWPKGTGETIRVATYNIHYGYDTDWHLSLEEQAQAIETSGADVVMLQEVDTGRPTSYMIDDELWLSRHVGEDPAYPGMEAVYLPTVERLTGIALLSRYPVLDSETLLLPSELEQTGIIWAELEVGDKRVNAFAIWLGLEPEERARQLDAALEFIKAHPGPAVFGGDFNSTPDSPVHSRIEDAGFVDPFPALGLGSPPTSPAIDPAERIDFVWLRDLAPLDAQVLDSTASDHRLVVVETALP